ncbi:MAG TPA: class I SAM-dependent methyltransferase [Bacteroidota bacterium]
MKDLFSGQAELYARYRPVYPRALFDYILGFVTRTDAALDCATGNGQVARSLSPSFRSVHAIDISENQLSHAVKAGNIHYQISPAEHTPFSDDTFNLVTVAQAYHWFDTAQFCREAKRIAQPDAVVAVWGYDLATVEPRIDPLIHHWNYDILSKYWEAERTHVTTHYEHLAFDFERLPSRDFQIIADWTLDEFIGHLRTWSALQTMIHAVGDGPFHEFLDELARAWTGSPRKRCTFPLFLKLGRVRKQRGDH